MKNHLKKLIFGAFIGVILVATNILFFKGLTFCISVMNAEKGVTSEEISTCRLLGFDNIITKIIGENPAQNYLLPFLWMGTFIAILILMAIQFINIFKKLFEPKLNPRNER